ncbi:MAG: cbb3-type cytochrome c oxidase subunit 3 [Albidovulum sp.]
MDLYSLMREFADSWALLALFGVFVTVVIWVFRPGSRAVHADVAQIPFRHENRPATADERPKEALK